MKIFHDRTKAFVIKTKTGFAGAYNTENTKLSGAALFPTLREAEGSQCEGDAVYTVEVVITRKRKPFKGK